MSVDIRKPLKKMLPYLIQAQADKLNEADTVQRLIKFFEDVLGYDPMSDISREAEMKKKFVDVVLKIEGVVRLLVEAKAADETLRDRHIEQAQSYASRNNYKWVLLTNGVVWNLYHLTFEEGIEYERAFTVDLSKPETLDESAGFLSLLHKQAMKKDDLEDFWTRSRALSPASISKAILHERVLGLVRREIRKDIGLLIDPEDLAQAIHKMWSAEVREQIGPVRIRKRRVRRAGTDDEAGMEPSHEEKAPPSVAPASALTPAKPSSEVKGAPMP